MAKIIINAGGQTYSAAYNLEIEEEPINMKNNVKKSLLESNTLNNKHYDNLSKEEQEQVRFELFEAINKGNFKIQGGLGEVIYEPPKEEEMDLSLDSLVAQQSAALDKVVQLNNQISETVEGSLEDLVGNVLEAVESQAEQYRNVCVVLREGESLEEDRRNAGDMAAGIKKLNNLLGFLKSSSSTFIQ